MSPTNTFLIRQANELDIAPITQIYNGLILHRPSTAQIDTVSVEDREAWFASQDRSRYPVFIYESQGSILGYLSLSAYRPGRRALSSIAEVSYFVAPDAQRSGVGSHLLQHTLDACPKLQIKHLLAILLETNAASIGLLEKFGFQRWGHLPGIAEIQGQWVGQYYYGLDLKP